MFVSFCSYVLSILMTVICTVTAPLNIWTKADYTPIDKENCKLSFATMSDVHLDSSFLRMLNLELGIKDLEDSEYKVDALCFTGDITDHGYLEHYEAFKKIMTAHNPAKTIIMTMGNHDLWTEKTGRVLADKYYYEYNKLITGRDLDNTYYSTIVNGYHFINLCSELTTTDGYISEEQVAWLDKELEAASKDNLPIFVISHWPINQTHGLPEVDGETEPMKGGLGINSDKVDAVLQKYKNIFYISGHIHLGLTNDFTSKIFNYNSVEKHGNVTCINLPCYQFGNTSKGHCLFGTGCVFEAYDDEVIIRGRNYAAGVWLDNYQYEIKLVK